MIVAMSDPVQAALITTIGVVLVALIGKMHIDNRKDHGQVRDAIKGLRGDVQGVQVDVGAVKTDVAAVKIDVASMKADVAHLKGDVQQVQADVIEVEEIVHAGEVTEIRPKRSRRRKSVVGE